MFVSAHIAAMYIVADAITVFVTKDAAVAVDVVHIVFERMCMALFTLFTTAHAYANMHRRTTHGRMDGRPSQQPKIGR